MAVDQHGNAEGALRIDDQPAQRSMIRFVIALDPRQRFLHRQPLVINLAGVANDARDGAEPAGNTQRARVGEGREPPIEHARIELVGLAIDVEEGARKMRMHDRHAELDGVGEQLVDEGVLRASQRGEIETALREEARRISAAAVRRVADDGPRERGRLHYFEGRIEVVRDSRTHASGPIPNAKFNLY